MHNKTYFKKLFERFPILFLFNSSGIQVSTDETQKDSSHATWCKDMYSALKDALSSTKPDVFPVSSLRQDVHFPQQRSIELERTVLSIMVAEAILENKALEIFGDKWNLPPEYSASLHSMMTEHGKDDKFLLAMIFADIAKIDAVREYFRENTALQSNDQDIALSHITSQPSELLASAFALSPNQMAYIINFSAPLHLGHAAQAECTANKFREFQEFILKQEQTTRKKIIEVIILKQLLDVAGARAQNGGSILLNKPIFEAYASLRTSLLHLANNDNYNTVYWDHVAQPLLENWAEQDLYQSGSRDIDTYSARGVLLRLIRQLRLPEHGDKFPTECRQLKNIISVAEKEPRFSNALKFLKEYDDNMPHTMTYGPAIYATLYRQALNDEIDIHRYGFKNPIEYTAQVGTVILGRAAETYLSAVSQNETLQDSPLCFNHINSLIQKNPIAALQLFAGTRGIAINSANGNVTYKPNKSHGGLWASRIPPSSPSLKPLASNEHLQQGRTLRA